MKSDTFFKALVIMVSNALIIPVSFAAPVTLESIMNSYTREVTEDQNVEPSDNPSASPSGNADTYASLEGGSPISAGLSLLGVDPSPKPTNDYGNSIVYNGDSITYSNVTYTESAQRDMENLRDQYNALHDCLDNPSGCGRSSQGDALDKVYFDLFQSSTFMDSVRQAMDNIPSYERQGERYESMLNSWDILQQTRDGLSARANFMNQERLNSLPRQTDPPSQWSELLDGPVNYEEPSPSPESSPIY